MIWGFAAHAELVSPRLLPGPLETLGQFWNSMIYGDLLQDFWNTLRRTLYAFAIAAIVGIPLGVMLGSSRKLYGSVEFLVDFFRSTPATAMFPLFLLLFGIGEESQVAVAAFAALLIVIFSAAYGVINATKTRVLAARVMGAGRWRVFKDVMIYESLPQTFVGLRTAISLALVVIIVAEMFIGSSDGLGRRIIDAQQVYDLREMYASIIATGVMGYSLNLLFIAVERRVVRWIN
ncbi:taurine ABC transporter permease [Ectothiorhodosinus mongolicus]|nr:taurine ABC transporter permease [Ectothiorhodosinus mongolicus]